jgi:hypothetical protein
MLLGVLTILVMAGVTIAFWREGLLTALTMTINIVLAGLAAFAFFEPIAGLLVPGLAGSFLAGYEDALCLIVLFTVSLGLLRLITNNLASAHLEYPAVVRQGGSAVFALVAGYLTSGFLLCVLQTLPWQVDFLGFDYHAPNSGNAVRSVLPPDHIWLAMMHNMMPDFDPDSTFEARYARFRRYDDQREALPYRGEFEK